jgi:hypothetical protein
MIVDCLWIEKNLEALFSDTLSDDESRLARSHIETCAACRQETMALNAIDPLIKNHFRRELAIARRPPLVHKARVLGLSGAAAAVVALLLLFATRTPQAPPVAPAVASVPPTTVAAPETPVTPPIKADDPTEIQRAKPTPAPNAVPDRKPQLPQPVTANSPELLVTDAAGYSHSLDEFRGRAVVIAVWDNDQSESIANIERLYKANVANPKIRFVVVSNERLPKPPNTTFQTFYNQGSKLFGAKPGEFVMLNENGATELKGSLVKDIESLRKELQNK